MTAGTGDRVASGAITYPFGRDLAKGELVEVAPGILCLRLPLPIELDHVNVYLLEDDGGWALFDTGIADDTTWSIWRNVIAERLGGRPIVRIVSSHFHVDHAGLAGRLADLFGCPLYMTQTEYLMARLACSPEPMTTSQAGADFFLEAGASPEEAQRMSISAFRLGEVIDPMPAHFVRLADGDTLGIGGRSWRVLTGSGHSPEQLMLHDPVSRVFISADQVLPEITPNVSVWPMQPDADPLGDYLTSISRITEEVDDPLVLPCHRYPFHGLQPRIRAIRDHHLRRCEAIIGACGEAALNAIQLVPTIFGRRIDEDAMDLAVGEALAHANYLRASGDLRQGIRDGVRVYQTSAAARPGRPDQ